jgi:hypothetical protein
MNDKGSDDDYRNGNDSAPQPLTCKVTGKYR